MKHVKRMNLFDRARHEHAMSDWAWVTINEDNLKEIAEWLSTCDLPGWWEARPHPGEEFWMVVAFSDKDAAFAFKMQFG